MINNLNSLLKKKVGLSYKMEELAFNYSYKNFAIMTTGWNTIEYFKTRITYFLDHLHLELSWSSNIETMF